MTYLIGLAVVVILMVIGWKGIHRVGNYESRYGYLLFYPLPIFIIACIIGLTLA